MTLNDAIKFAAALMDMGSEKLSDEKTLTSLLQCAMLAYSDITSEYLPLTVSETVKSDGQVNYGKLSRQVQKIISVRRKGGKCRFKCFPGYFETEAKGDIEVEYSYLPEACGIDEPLELRHTLTPLVLGLGTASQYCLRTGLYEKSVIFSERYRDALKSLCSAGTASKYLPNRRWL